MPGTLDDDFPVLTEIVRAPRPGAAPAAKPEAKVLAPASAPVAVVPAPVVPAPQPQDRLARTMPLEALYGQTAVRPIQVPGSAPAPGSAAGVSLDLDHGADRDTTQPAAQRELALRPEEVAQVSMQLRDEIEGAILRDLNMRIEPLVEARLKEKLADLLEQVLAGMTAELKLTVRDIVREAVDQAVAQEWAARDKRILQATRPPPK